MVVMKFNSVFPPLHNHLHTGSFPVLSLMVGAVVTRLVPDEGPSANLTVFAGLDFEQQRIVVASSLTFLMGIFQVDLTFIPYHTIPYHTITCHTIPIEGFSKLAFFPLIFMFHAACHGCSADRFHCCVPVRHSGVWLHHSSCCPYPDFPAQICVGI